jgi:thymidylate kinase
MELICITGMDGVGKTTLAKELVKALNGNGKQATYRYGRVVPVLSRLIMRVGRRLFLPGYDPNKDYEEYIDKKKKAMSSSIFRLGYSAAVYLDYFPQIWLKLLLLGFSTKIIVMDRFFQDTLINEIAVQLGYSLDEFNQVLSRGLRLLPQVKLTILIDLPEEIAFSRKSDIPHIDYLRERRRYYRYMREFPGFHCISGKHTPKEILQYTLSAYDSTLSSKLDETINFRD